jgi:polyisoprenoid-binding protein YceI
MSDISLRRPNPNFQTKIIGGLIIVALSVLVLLVGGLAYIWFSGGTGQPSSATVAPALVREAGDTRALFHIVPEESEVRFIIRETLLGAPKTVIGVTNQVSADLLVDFDSPANSQLGPVRINVRTLKTDNEFRNRALRGQILQSERDEYEFAEFVPTTLLGLPETLPTNATVTFQIKGNLTVRGVTREVTFDASLTPINETRLEGTAQTLVNYQDFSMSIPEAPGVANVSDDVRLEIDFVALLADGE